VTNALLKTCKPLKEMVPAPGFEPEPTDYKLVISASRFTPYLLIC